MQRTTFGLIALIAAACGTGSDGATAVDVLTARAVAGEEERLTDQGTVAPEGDLLPPLRACDARGEFERLFTHADEDASGELEDGEARRVRRHHGPPPPVLHLLKWVYDADDSGDLDDAERAALLADHTARCEALQARLLEDFDADGDGELSDEELEAARDAAPPRPEGGRGHHGGHHGPPPGACDRDADSADTDAPERCGPPPAHDGPPPPVLDEFDADGDGALSADEAATARATIRARVAAGEPPVAPPPSPPEE